MGMNVHDAQVQETAYGNSPEQIAAARLVIDASLAGDPKHADVVAMIFGGES